MLRAGLWLLFGMNLTPLMEAQPAPQMAGQLAARISSLLQRRATVSLDFQNLSSLAPAESSSFRSALESELRKTGTELVATAQPEWRVRVAISENPHGLLLVAEVLSAGNRQVAMLPWSTPLLADASPRVRLSQRAIWEQADPVLDFLLLESDAELLVLGATNVTSYRLANGKWTARSVASLTPSRPLPRDPRGRLQTAPGGFRVYLPGTTCNGTLEPTLRLTCAPGNEMWPIDPRDPGLQARWVTDRNMLELESPSIRFFTEAAGLFATNDNRVVNRSGESVPGAEAWGSDVAGIENPCGLNATIVAAKNGDQLQIYEVANGRAVASGEPLALSGSVTALWPVETRDQATLVIRNPKTGNYEASRLRVACAQ
jgi:hypothetical protein